MPLNTGKKMIIVIGANPIGKTTLSMADKEGYEVVVVTEKKAKKDYGYEPYSSRKTDIQSLVMDQEQFGKKFKSKKCDKHHTYKTEVTEKGNGIFTKLVCMYCNYSPK